MSRYGLLGGFSQSQSLAADAQACINLYFEKNETGKGKSEGMLVRTPGTALWGNAGVALGGRAIHTNPSTGRSFTVIGTVLYEISSIGGFTNRGTVINDGNPASFASSTTQLAVCSGGTLYVLSLATNAFASASVNAETIVQIGYSDGFFIALVASSNRFYISAPLDATTWTALNQIIVSVFPDQIVSLIVDHRFIWVHGQTRSTVYYNSAGAIVPYDVLPGSTMEQGCGATWATAKVDNTVVWLGSDERGPGMFWRAVGYIPQRISTHAIENEIRTYKTRSDAIAFSHQHNGHAFYRVSFPTAGKTWEWDAATGQWHQVAYFNRATGLFEASHNQFHTYNDSFGAHLVTDTKSGRVFSMSLDFPDDAGNPIRWVRHSPYIAQEGEWLYHQEMQIDVENGLGPQPPLLDGAGKPRDPQIMVRWSDTQGKTWSNEHIVNCGQAGNFLRARPLFRLGRSRGRIYEIAGTDAIAWRLIDGYLKANPGYESRQRTAREYGKVA